MAKLNEYEFESLLDESLKLFDEGCSVLEIRDSLMKKNVSSKDINVITDKLKNKILTDESNRINESGRLGGLIYNYQTTFALSFVIGFF